VRSIRVLFLSYGYMPTGRLEPYRERLIQILAGTNCEVLVIKTNSFFEEYSHLPRLPHAVPYLVSQIKQFTPDVIVSINRTGLVSEILTATKDVPILTLFQDPHYYASDQLLKFSARDLLCFIFPNPDFYEQELVPFALKRGASSDRLINVPFALDTFTFHPTGKNRDIEVSFVGSSFGTDFAKLLTGSLPDAAIRNILVQTFLAHRNAFIADVPLALREAGVDLESEEFFRSRLFDPNCRLMLEAIKDGSLSLQGIFDDQINAERRIHHLSALTDFDFRMYGLRDDIWIEQMSLVNPKLLACYQYRAINEPDELAAIYNRSKIGFNISRIAAADKGFSFRVPEVIACEALLVTEHYSIKPLLKTGLSEGKHFISYDSPDNIRRKCYYYLRNESERLEIVAAARKAINECGPQPTIHGVLGLCLLRAGFQDLASSITSLEKRQLRLTNRVTMLGDFRGAFLGLEVGEGYPHVVDISIDANVRQLLLEGGAKEAQRPRRCISFGSKRLAAIRAKALRALTKLAPDK